MKSDNCSKEGLWLILVSQLFIASIMGLFSVLLISLMWLLTAWATSSAISVEAYWFQNGDIIIWISIFCVLLAGWRTHRRLNNSN